MFGLGSLDLESRLVVWTWSVESELGLPVRSLYLESTVWIWSPDLQSGVQSYLDLETGVLTSACRLLRPDMESTIRTLSLQFKLGACSSDLESVL